MILTPSQTLDIFHRRVSTRYYDPARTISADDFAAILECGRLSPSSVGSEPWRFIIVQNRALRDKLKPVAWGMQATLDDASHVVIILAKKHARYDSAFFDAIVKKRSSNDTEAQRIYQRYRDFQTNDLRIADDERALFDWACKQTYIALANMMTGAAMLGIDSCAIEGMHYDSVNRILSEEGLLDTEDYGVSVAVTFGYRARDIAAKPRRPLAEIVRWAE